MKYLCIVFYDEQIHDGLSDQELQALDREAMSFDEELRKSGHLVLAHPLAKVHASSKVQIRAGSAIVTDGPFVETNEQIGGIVLLEAADLNQAIQIASQIPPARLGGVEVRPVLEWEPTGPVVD